MQIDQHPKPDSHLHTLVISGINPSVRNDLMDRWGDQISADCHGKYRMDVHPKNADRVIAEMKAGA